MPKRKSNFARFLEIASLVISGLELVGLNPDQMISDSVQSVSSNKIEDQSKPKTSGRVDSLPSPPSALTQ